MKCHINRTTVIGRLGADCTRAVMPDGATAIHFSVCHKRPYETKEGERGEQLTWFDCTLWRGPGKPTGAANRLVKGSLVFVEGEVGFRVRTPADGQPMQVSLTIRVSDVHVVASRSLDDHPFSEEPAVQIIIPE